MLFCRILYSIIMLTRIAIPLAPRRSMRNSASVRKSARSELLCCFLALVFTILYTYLIESYTN